MLPNSFSHLTGKLIFSQKEWVRHQIRFAFCFKCLQMLFSMLSNYTFDAFLHGQSIQSVEIERLEFGEGALNVSAFNQSAMSIILGLCTVYPNLMS